MPPKSMIILCLLLVIVLPCSLRGSTPDWLGVCGSEIIDEQGQEVLLRGMNMDLYYYLYEQDPDAPFEYASEEDIEYLAGIGCNSLRLCLNWKMFQSDEGFRLIDMYLSWCEPRGIYLILDMHIAPPGGRSSNREIWSSAEARMQLDEIWLNIATRYAHCSGIAGYDLYNEPSPHEPSQWWDLSQQLVETIRSADENHILFIERSSRDGTGFRILDDPNVVYSFHYYQPFVISHATATWPGDSPVPDEYIYPGSVINGMQWVDWSSEVHRLTLPANDWIEWESGLITVPTGVEWASLKLHASGNVGSVLFDDIHLLHNGIQVEAVNMDVEVNSPRRAGEAQNWYFYGEGDFSGMVASDSYSGFQSLELSGSSGSASWIQTRSFYTEPLLRVQPGDILQVRGMIKAPENSGEISLGMDFLKGNYRDFDIDWLRNDISRVTDWASDNEVPLYVGEFGSMAGSYSDSRYSLVSDWLTVFNELGLHWSFWTYRNPGGQAFGLWYQGTTLDEGLADILSEGFLSQQ